MKRNQCLINGLSKNSYTHFYRIREEGGLDFMSNPREMTPQRLQNGCLKNFQTFEI